MLRNSCFLMKASRAESEVFPLTRMWNEFLQILIYWPCSNGANNVGPTMVALESGPHLQLKDSLSYSVEIFASRACFALAVVDNY